MSNPTPDPFAAFAHRLAACIRLLGSDKSGEVAAAWAIIQRILPKADLHELATRIETPPGLDEAIKQKLRKAVEDARAQGYAEGVQAAERAAHGTEAFRSTDAPEWARVALYVQREKGRLPARHHEFVDKMAARTVYENEPTPNMHRYLHSLFLQLGGKIT
jgi:hypothetical protein